MMAIGPVQLLVLGFDHPDFQGEISKELQLLRDNDLVRVIDMLAVGKDAQGNVAVLAESPDGGPDGAEFGAVVGALLGLGSSGPEGVAAPDDGAPDGGVPDGGAFDEEPGWDVLAEIPDGSAAALILLEHRWAIPLRGAIGRAGGFRLASEFISPLDLAAVGLLSAEEADALVAADSGAL